MSRRTCPQISSRIERGLILFDDRENPVGGATGVQYTRRSLDGMAQRRELASIRDREVDYEQALITA
ncbi:MAG TPA: hypothetical protein PLY87_07345 [Planctomycetaceae bacterium]|nr:hypothetical protein [Planctomycetaceae bacterium]HQZ64872.1 hypothetical protein [Planctomycetaceae bacterium]